jgi:hypothetical protein
MAPTTNNAPAMVNRIMGFGGGGTMDAIPALNAVTAAPTAKKSAPTLTDVTGTFFVSKKDCRVKVRTSTTSAQRAYIAAPTMAVESDAFDDPVAPNTADATKTTDAPTRDRCTILSNVSSVFCVMCATDAASHIPDAVSCNTVFVALSS